MLNCRRRKLQFHHVMVAYLQRRHYKPVGRPMRACHPRDLLDQVTALCRFRGVEPTIYARALLARGRAAFDELRQGIRDIEFLANPTSGELTIGYPESMARVVLPTMIERFFSACGVATPQAADVIFSFRCRTIP